MDVETRDAEGICLTVSDAQARALRRHREVSPEVRFAGQIRPDGSRAVVTRWGALIMDAPELRSRA